MFRNYIRTVWIIKFPLFFSSNIDIIKHRSQQLVLVAVFTKNLTLKFNMRYWSVLLNVNRCLVYNNSSRTNDNLLFSFISYHYFCWCLVPEAGNQPRLSVGDGRAGWLMPAEHLVATATARWHVSALGLPVATRLPTRVCCSVLISKRACVLSSVSHCFHHLRVGSSPILMQKLWNEMKK